MIKLSNPKLIISGEEITPNPHSMEFSFDSFDSREMNYNEMIKKYGDFEVEFACFNNPLFVWIWPDDKITVACYYELDIADIEDVEIDKNKLKLKVSEGKFTSIYVVDKKTNELINYWEIGEQNERE